MPLMRDLGIINVKDPAYGALGNGTANDTAAFTAAFAAASDVAHINPTDQVPRVTGGTVFIPPGQYRVKNLTIDRSMSLIGCYRASRLMPTSDMVAGDWVLRCIRHGSNADYRYTNHHPGVILQDFMIDGLNRTIQCDGLVMDKIDRSKIDNVLIENIDGCGLDIRESCRETTYTHCRLRECGRRAPGARPALNLFDNGSLNLDGHNNIHFVGGAVVFSHGHSIEIGASATVQTPTRNLFFSHCLIHGLTGGTDSHWNILGGNHIHIMMCRIHNWGAGFGAIQLDSSDVVVTSCNFSRPDAGGAPSLTSPHARITGSGTIQSANNVFEQQASAIMLVDRPGGGTHRHFSYVDNP